MPTRDLFAVGNLLAIIDSMTIILSKNAANLILLLVDYRRKFVTPLGLKKNLNDGSDSMFILFRHFYYQHLSYKRTNRKLMSVSLVGMVLVVSSSPYWRAASPPLLSSLVTQC